MPLAGRLPMANGGAQWERALISPLHPPPPPPPPRAALQITNFRVPAFVPSTLPTGQTPPDLAKPILFDCDYDYRPDEDARLTVKWFKNKEAEPFYQWLPELKVRHLADWIRPLVNQSFVSDPHDPMKRYRSLLVRRLSMNLTGQYTCVVSSLANQDLRQASLVVYQPPRSFTFEHRIYPAPAGALPAPSASASTPAPWAGAPGASTTQFRGLNNWAPPPPPPPNKSHQQQQPPPPGGAVIVRPANNNDQTQQHPGQAQPALASLGQPANATKIVYTHDGRPIRRKSKRQAPISGWQLKKKQAGSGGQAPEGGDPGPARPQNYFAIQLHHFQCQATQVTPRPVLVLTVKRGADAIAQYLHESSSVSVRPYQVSQAQLFRDETGAGGAHSALPVTLYDITVSTTVALNVSLAPAHHQRPPAPSGGADQLVAPGAAGPQDARQPPGAWHQDEHSSYHLQPAQPAINTVLGFRRGQRMSFECHLEITGTEFEQRKRINMNEEGE